MRFRISDVASNIRSVGKFVGRPRLRSRFAKTQARSVLDGDFLYLDRLPPFFEHKSKIDYSKVELVKGTAEMEHPAVRGILTELGVTDGLEIHHDADLPARSGLGSNSLFTVGLLNALYALDGRLVSRRDLGRRAIRIEQEVFKEDIGCQDQIWAVYGGFDRTSIPTAISPSGNSFCRRRVAPSWPNR
jgi:hypothetical protein